ncbi:hypothetical protein KHC33_04095 [Methanospirillum sp. J.3.6.1-F.2.7.3]|uniref:Uncharacterized protein n=1 Tax=Methanospirillum purgamenti TaxID=2834276 RepID=A0A8E7B0H6_9EURY|nr:MULTISPECIES: hypothetical protein [Methanospirillum]MDX8551778.1 hypothetical protein [Methanospirillum hungatei]QVV89704.1 hypothetical protein KHC33_04095 [Methanospirillum sp. J.3.6.1-F.2.7.3]
MDINWFIQVVSNKFGWKITIVDDQTRNIFPFAESDKEGDPELSIRLDLLNLDKKIVSLKKFIPLYEGCALYSEHKYEILLSRRSNVFSNPKFIKNLENIEDSRNKFIYSISDISQELYLHFMETFIQKNSDIAFFLRPFPRDLKEIIKESPDIELLDFLSKNFRYLSIKIESEEKKSEELLHSLVISHLFNISYQTGMTFVPFFSIEQLFKSYRSFSRQREKNFAPPRKIYNQNVISYYQMARTTDNPSLKFLSFYQILEYFFNAEYYQNLRNDVRMKITHPAFSFESDKSIQELILLINNQIRYGKTQKQKNEYERLKSLLNSNFNDFSSLIQQLNEYDESLIEYYSKNHVSFCKGPFVDFLKSNINEICEKLSSRIYKIRNAIVHSKDDNEYRYIPFRDDKELYKEIPLIQLISEEIIIKHSKYFNEDIN